MTFKAINWTPNEIISESKMDDMMNNQQDLYNTTPRAIYTLPGIARAEGVRLASGRALFTAAPKTDSAYVTVRFGEYFSNGCQPNVTTGVVTDMHSKFFCIVNGIGRVVPDHQGFQIYINVAATSKSGDVIRRTMYVQWIAMGY